MHVAQDDTVFIEWGIKKYYGFVPVSDKPLCFSLSKILQRTLYKDFLQAYPTFKPEVTDPSDVSFFLTHVLCLMLLSSRMEDTLYRSDLRP